MGSAVATGALVAAGRWVGPGRGRRGVARAVAVLLLGTVLVSSCATGGGRPQGAARGTSRPLLAPTGSSPTLAAPPAAPVGPVSPDGALPQTGESPSAASSTFRAQMAYLWQAVVSGDPADALPAFFPLAAYRQVKTVPDPAADWGDRLLGGFALDIRAAHDLLGPAAADGVDPLAWTPRCCGRVERCQAVRSSSRVMGSSQQGQVPPVPSRVQNRLQSWQRCCPT